MKTYMVLAVGEEGVALKLIETFWYRRAVAAFNAAKDSGRWTLVQVRLGERVCVTYRRNAEAADAAPPPLPGKRPAPRGAASRSRPNA